MYYKAPNLGPIHLLKNLVILPLLLIANVRNLTSLSQLIVAFEDCGVDVLVNGLPLLKRNQAYLGSPSHYEISEVNFSVYFVGVDLMNHFHCTLFNLSYIFALFVFVGYLLVEGVYQFGRVSTNTIESFHAMY